jgi:hypothetical protein
LFSGSTLLNLNYVLGRRTFGPVNDVELHLSTFGKGLETLGLNGAMMNEAISASVGWGDESKPLLIVEPLHSSLGTHHALPCLFDGRSADDPYLPTTFTYAADSARSSWPTRPLIEKGGDLLMKTSAFNLQT